MIKKMMCRKCKTIQPITEFRHSKTSASGYDARCKSCERERSRIYRELNRDKVRESNNRYSKTEKGKARSLRFSKTDKFKEILKRYNASGKGAKNFSRYYYSEKGMATIKHYREVHADKFRRLSNEWMKAHPEVGRMAASRRRANLRNNKIYEILPKEIRKLYSQPCFMCGSTEDQTIDHKIPVARGGSHGIGNLITLCRSCNCKKHDRLFIEWKHNKTIPHKKQIQA
jgi:5-methylcytosine-specific restriction endonuclease McrA